MMSQNSVSSSTLKKCTIFYFFIFFLNLYIVIFISIYVSFDASPVINGIQVILASAHTHVSQSIETCFTGFLPLNFTYTNARWQMWPVICPAGSSKNFSRQVRWNRWSMTYSCFLIDVATSFGHMYRGLMKPHACGEHLFASFPH